VGTPPISTGEDPAHYSVAEFIARRIERAVQDVALDRPRPPPQTITAFRSLVKSVIREAPAKFKVLLIMLVSIERVKLCILLNRREFSYACNKVSSLESMFVGAFAFAQKVRSAICPESSQFLTTFLIGR
jgi:hypothetical protein